MINPSPWPDYAGAIAYALQLLHSRLPAAYTYHCAAHTEHDVIPAVVRLGHLAGISEQASQQLQVAAAYHDLGYIETPQNHEAIGIAYLSDKLPRLGFEDAEITLIAGMIQATRMPQSPLTDLEALMADADLDSLGRDDFLQTSKALWQEQPALGQSLNWNEWLSIQLRFMQTHRYFSPVARALRDAGKQRNTALLLQMIGNGNNDSASP
jgi:uncharacterized protein